MKDQQMQYFSVLGDSISTLDGFSYPLDAVYYTNGRKFETGVFSPEDTWWGQVIAHFGGRLLVNDSFSGSTAVKSPACFVESYGCSDERTSYLHKGEGRPDVIMVFLGTNDRGIHAKPAATEPADWEDLSVFSTAYTIMLKKLRANYPDAQIWCLTLPVSTWSANVHYKFPFTFAGSHVEEYCAVIRDCANKQGCRVIDLYAQTLARPYDTVDGCHANASGMKTLADAVLAELQERKGE